MSTRTPIAIVGMACRYPDARSPAELWENALAQRRAFRRIPSVRLRHEDYYSPDRAACDSVYTMQAAVLEGYEFDRHRFNISGSTFRSVDLAHWLALDVAAAAIDDAGFPQGRDLPRQGTAVIVGNTLTGEFSRANLLRTRWPYVRRTVEHALAAERWDAPRRHAFLADLERQYKAPFPPGNEETLAGGLSNTIAGRICNYFDLKGGGYTVDGACASSLLAIMHACTLLQDGELEMALAGGVDLSLDPFELVGFSRAGALAEHEMRVYDVRSQGFWPGEGCGFVTLMRQDDALRQGRRIWATLRGWGVSSDGAGGITRPEVEGQVLCLQRAYRGLDFKISDVEYFEGHGTGTAVGDATELKALALARRQAGANGHRAAVGSIKANIGHTKAAAGVAGLIKATMALHEGLLPPTTACSRPHPELAESSLEVLQGARAWSEATPRYAGVSAMGFGGINSHLVLEAPLGSVRRPPPAPAAQDCELFLMDAADVPALREKVRRLRQIAPDLSRAELSDVMASLTAGLTGGAIRAAVVAAEPAALARHLDTLLEWLAETPVTRLDAGAGIFLGVHPPKARIGLLCPGQGYAISRDGGAAARRFAAARAFYEPPITGDDNAATVVQPAVVRASLAGMRVLDDLGIHAELALGHSLGELTALCWAGAFDQSAVLRLAALRGRAMTELSAGGGAMAGIGADPALVRTLCAGDGVVIACFNGPRETVVSGPADEVRALVARARDRGLPAFILKTTHAFHSPLVAPAAAAFPQAVREVGVHPMKRKIVSTVTATVLEDRSNIPEMLGRQIASPVRFVEAIAKASQSVDLFIEVGSGNVLTRLATEATDIPAVAMDVGGDSLAALLGAVGAAFVIGAEVAPAALLADRFVRPFSLDWKPRFLANPCEQAPLVDGSSAAPVPPAPATADDRQAASTATPAKTVNATALDVLRAVIAAQEELQPESIRPESHLLKDLHLNSLKVAEIVARASRQLGLPRPASPMEMAAATVGQIAQALEQQKRTGTSGHDGEREQQDSPFPPGVDTWVRAFKTQWLERPCDPAVPRPAAPKGDWLIFGAELHPLAARLQQELAAAIPAGGVALCLSADPDQRQVTTMLAAAQAALARQAAGAPARFVVLHHGGGAALAKTFFLEAPGSTVCAVEAPLDDPRAVKWTADEALSAQGFCETRYDAAGRRWVPRLLAHRTPPDSSASDLGLGALDVLLVSGGGKGIAAECALELARQTGTRLLLIGRSHPDDDAALAANLARLAKHGVRFAYQPADVTDPQAVRRAVDLGRRQLGPVTAILHGAGVNVPRLLSQLTAEDFIRTLRPKHDGLMNLLASIDADKLRLLVTFGSVIARFGLAGEADYAVANEWMGRIVERFQERHPACRCLNLEWSVWSGVGMGPRLGSITPLMAQGISPISPDAGVKVLLDLLRDPRANGSIIVSGRYGALATLKSDSAFAPGPFTRKLRCFFPGVELIAEIELSSKNDRYLSDHAFGGRILLPGVIGMEIMAEAAAQLSPSGQIAALEDVRFDHPIEIPPDEPTVLRVAALVRRDGRIEVVLRSAATGFAVNHFSATCRPRDSAAEAPSTITPAEALLLAEAPKGGNSAATRLDPAKDLYGRILFQGKTFHRLHGYDLLRARQCVARITLGDADDGIGERRHLALGDPAGRDAAIHAIQACIPHITVLPVSIERLELHQHASGLCRVMARERSRDPEGFVYDVAVISDNGRLAERWSGLRLQIAGEPRQAGSWPVGLLSPYLERRVGELLPESAIALDASMNGDARRMMRRGIDPDHRPDGKPDSPRQVRHESRTYFAGCGLAGTADLPLAVDAQAVDGRSAEQWAQVLGPQRMAVARMAGDGSQVPSEPLATSACRVWCALECLGKLAAPPDAPLIVAARTPDRWTLLQSGHITVATCVVPVVAVGDVCFAFAAGRPIPVRPKTYEFAVHVGFDEVNRMGTVNFQSYFNWQARCREAFLRDHAPTVLRDLHDGAILVTTDASCQYLAEIVAEHEVIIRMTLGELGEHQVNMQFEYLQVRNGREVVVARGRQTTASMRRHEAALTVAPLPSMLRAALAQFEQPNPAICPRRPIHSPAPANNGAGPDGIADVADK